MVHSITTNLRPLAQGSLHHNQPAASGPRVHSITTNLRPLAQGSLHHNQPAASGPRVHSITTNPTQSRNSQPNTDANFFCFYCLFTEFGQPGVTFLPPHRLAYYTTSHGFTTIARQCSRRHTLKHTQHMHVMHSKHWSNHALWTATLRCHPHLLALYPPACGQSW
jgi:hypothetical protein